MRGNFRLDVESVRKLNHLIDESLLALAPLLMKVGFISGTTDLLLSGVLALNPWFQIGWALTQAVAVDSLFFVVAFCFWNTDGWKNRWTFGVLLVLYGLVAFFVTDVQAFQQLETATAAVSMNQLRISPVVFTNIRSGLVILTASLFYLVERKVRQLEASLGVAVPPAPTHVEEETEMEQAEPEPIQIPEHAASLETRILDILKTEPTIGPTALAKRLGIHKSKAFRELNNARRKYEQPQAGS